MERLTKKHDGRGSYTQFGDKYIPNHNIRHKQFVEKLGKLEDIEEELGIPLEVLFKALKDGFWFKDSGRVFLAKQAGVFNGVSGTYWFSGMGTMVKVKDYGKTWSLNKEELE